MRSAAFDGSRSDQSFPSRSTKKGRLPPGWLDIHTLGPIPTEGPQNVRISKGTRRSTPLDLDPWELCPHGAEDGLDRRLLERFCHCLSLSQPDLQPLKARTPEIERLPRPAPDRPIGSDVESISDDDPLTLKRENPGFRAGLFRVLGGTRLRVVRQLLPADQGKCNESLLQPPCKGLFSGEHPLTPALGRLWSPRYGPDPPAR